jgi:hypothetical protein
VISNICDEEVGTFVIRLFLEQDAKISVHANGEEPGPVLNASKFKPELVEAVWNFFSALKALEARGSPNFARLFRNRAEGLVRTGPVT